MLPFIYSYPYLSGISVALQIFCVIHCLRRSTQQKWLWIIIVLPFAGSIAYIYSEIYSRGQMRNLTAGLGNLFSPGVSIGKLEENLRFTDTFNNRMLLADAYLANGRTLEAIELYESSRTGAFEENEHVLLQLITAYFQTKQYEKLVPLARKMNGRPQFARSRAHVFYAISLGYIGDETAAEAEFKKMKARFSDFEARCQYGFFLQRAGRSQEARIILKEIVDEASHLGSRERRDASPWITQAKNALKEI